MPSYDVFARYYDALTGNVDYGARAEYLLSLLERFHHPAGLTLDLACGTGSLTLELARRGVDVYGVDASPEMLTEAKDKAAEEDREILFLCQKMQSLDLFGTVDTVFCALDSINHLPDRETVQAAFRRVAFFLNDDGWFVFDVNTPHKHAQILRNNTFVYDLPQVYCVWQNRYTAAEQSVSMTLDFFEKEGRMYARSTERFTERAYDRETLTEMLLAAGFDRVEFFGDLTFDPPAPQEARWVVAAHITNSQNAVFTG